MALHCYEQAVRPSICQGQEWTAPIRCMMACIESIRNLGAKCRLEPFLTHWAHPNCQTGEGGRVNKEVIICLLVGLHPKLRLRIWLYDLYVKTPTEGFQIVN